MSHLKKKDGKSGKRNNNTDVPTQNHCLVLLVELERSCFYELQDGLSNTKHVDNRTRHFRVRLIPDSSTSRFHLPFALQKCRSSPSQQFVLLHFTVLGARAS